MMPSSNLICILGPTASGKTSLAAHLAALIGAEIISGDSRQVYRGMNLGTGKDIGEYIIEGKPIPYHLIDIVDPGYEYNVFEFQRDFNAAFRKIQNRNGIAILCGGSGMYIDAVINAYDMRKVPENHELRNKLLRFSDEELSRKLRQMGPLHNISDTSDRSRLIRAIEIAIYKAKYPVSKDIPKINSLNFGTRYERAETKKRITERLESRLEEGMLDEVKGLLDSGLKPEQLTFYGLEYKFLTQHIMNEISYDEMFEALNTAIHQFAKRQMTWFRRMEKHGTKIHWIDGQSSVDEKLAVIIGLLPK